MRRFSLYHRNVFYYVRFWNPEKKSYGHSIGKRYCCEQTGRLHHWNAFFPEGIRLCDISKEHLKKFHRCLREKVAAKTANSVLMAGTVEFSWAYEHGILIDNPGKELKNFSGESKKRGILSLNKPAHFLHSFGMMNVLELGTL